MGKLIEVLCNDGSPLQISMGTLWGDDFRIGLGGAETALMTMCEAWHNRGDQVILYNDPLKSNDSPFEQRPVSAFQPFDPHEIVIFFRSPPTTHPAFMATTGLKIWWSTDQQSVGDFKVFSRGMDKIVCISPFHKQYFLERYQIENAIVIDLPVRVLDFVGVECEKVPQRVIFTSVPARGLDNLHRIWPRILEQVPEASLVITSDYRLWGVGPSNEHFRIKWMRQNNVMYFGALKRADYLKELVKAQLFLYPSNYDELFCIACAEAQVAGAYPITSSTGALPTTNMGDVINGNGDDHNLDSLFIERAVEKLRKQADIEFMLETTDRFRPDVILEQWDSKVFG